MARTLVFLALQLTLAVARKNLIIDTDIFSDCDDAAALLLAATSPDVNLLGVNVNSRSSYSTLATSAILAHYGHGDKPIGARRPLTDETFFDRQSFSLGEFASKVAYHWSGGELAWGHAEDAWHPVPLYRKLLAKAADGSVTIVSLGFLENLSGLLNSTGGDEYSPLSGPELVAAKVSELVVMGGQYPFGYEFNFWGDNASHAAHVVSSWKGRVVFSGYELGNAVMSGESLMAVGPCGDPVRAAYFWYTYRNPRQSWDPLTVLYAIRGLGDLFEFGNESGYNLVKADGFNVWMPDPSITNQHWLKLKVSNETARRELDRLYLKGARSFARSSASCADRARHGGMEKLEL